MQKIEITNTGQRMNGTLFVPTSQDKSPGVIFFHGLTSSEARYVGMAERLLENGIAALTINLRGHGTSEGVLSSLSLMDSISDAIAAYDFFAVQSGVDASRIGICGSSYGATLAAAVTAKRAVKSLLLRAPAAYTDAMIAMNFDDLMKQEDDVFKSMNDLESTRAIQDVSTFRGNLFVVASENDDIIPLKIPEAYFNAAISAEQKEFEIMKGAPHGLGRRPDLLEEFTVKMTNWFAKTL
jgi:hypothetical protein